MKIEAKKPFIMFSPSHNIPERWSTTFTGPVTTLLEVCIEAQHHVIARLIWTWNQKKDEFACLFAFRLGVQHSDDEHRIHQISECRRRNKSLQTTTSCMRFISEAFFMSLFSTNLDKSWWPKKRRIVELLEMRFWRHVMTSEKVDFNPGEKKMFIMQAILQREVSKSFVTKD